jgi:hypothetical protein
MKEFPLTIRLPFGRTILGLACLASSLAIPAAAQTADGTLTINGKVTKLAFAYAVAQPGFFDKTKEDVHVILSETALPPAAVLDSGELMRAIMTGNLRVVRVVLSADRQALSTVIDSPDLEMAVSFSGTAQKVALKTFDKDVVDGRVFLEKPDTFMKATYMFSVTFHAPIQRKHVLTAAEKKALADSPAAKAALAFNAAAHSGNVAALKAAVIPDMRKDLDGANGKKLLEMLKMTSPASPTVGAVEITGDHAVVTLEEKGGDASSSTTLSLTLTAGKWLVSR